MTRLQTLLTAIVFTAASAGFAGSVVLAPGATATLTPGETTVVTCTAGPAQPVGPICEVKEGGSCTDNGYPWTIIKNGENVTNACYASFERASEILRTLFQTGQCPRQ